MKRIGSVLVLLALVVSLLPSVALAADDWDVPGGHFFTQTGGGNGNGYTVTDDANAKFWSEFQRLGGVAGLGYPASRRFTWDGFTVQVFQRVILQWHADTQSAQFVNVFDRLSDLGKNDWLFTVKQTPRPTQFNEQGFTWNQVVAGRLALLDVAPPIKAAYYNVVGDPIQANGLPTSAVTDMGNNYSLRAQRVVFQLWKQDVPWAKAGTVTVALGGDIAKDAGILPDAGALQAGTSSDIAGGVVAPQVQWSTHTDSEKVFKYPSDWIAGTSGGLNAYWSKDNKAIFLYMAPLNMGANFNQQDFITSVTKGLATDGGLTMTTRATMTINGLPADFQYYETTNTSDVIVTIQKGGLLHVMIAGWDKASASTYQPILLAMIDSYMPQ